MFSESMNSWELGLAPSPLSFAINAKEEDVTDIFSEVHQDQSMAPPLELDIFEQELKRQEAVAAAATINIQEDLLISNIQEQRPAATATVSNTFAVVDHEQDPVAVDPKMISAAFDDSGLVADVTGSVEDTQTLIEEMESFLLQHEQADIVKQEEAVVNDSGLDLLEQVMEEVEMMPVDEEQKLPEANLSAEESQQAEAILDALIKGTLDADFGSSQQSHDMVVEETATTVTVGEKPAKKQQPIFSGINNISEVVTADGQKIVIVIANDLPADKEAAVSTIKAQVAAKAVAAPRPVVVSDVEEDSSDSDWTPYSPAPRRQQAKISAVSVVAPKTKGVSVGRVAKQRGPYSKRAHASVKDKKERKKLQNVEAARRYRDKKKLEQNVIEGEEDALAAKNKALKSKVSEMENELKTLKKLMTELGLVK